ncbi:MAG: hypothetical protein ACKO3N_09990 [Verrucomicrobiota bacterium]
MLRVVTALLALLLGARALAQVEVTLVPTQEFCLIGEDVELAVKIANFTGRPLILGADPRWLRFSVESTDGHVVNRIGEGEETGEFKLDTSNRATLRFNLLPLFDLSRPGRYRVFATLDVPGQGDEVSPPAQFEIIRGNRLWEREFGIASADPESPAPERRKYILQQANYLRALRLYLRITDRAEGRTFRVLHLGGIISFGSPSVMVDRRSRLHVLHPFAPDRFAYHVISPDGLVERRETWIGAGQRPELRVNETNQIIVFGGNRRPSPADLPARPPVPASTNPPPDEAAPDRKD